MKDEVLRLEAVYKSYDVPGGKLHILNGTDLSVGKGEIISIRGRSGSGKSTLLSVAALLLSADSGRILYSGKDTAALSGKEIEELRLRKMGFVFQSATLLDDFSAEENAAMPLLIAGERKKDAIRRADELLEALSVSDRKDHRPAELSGGERRRTEIARSLATSPKFLLLDEPFAGIDPKAVYEIKQIIKRLAASGIGILLTDHNVRDTLEITTTAHIISDGEILVSGTKEELLSNERAREIYFGRDFGKE